MRGETIDQRAEEQPADLGGGFVLHRRPDGETIIVATRLAGTGAHGFCSPVDVDARLDADALAWLESWGLSRERRLCSVAQMHGSMVIAASSIGNGESPEADGVWTTSTDDLLAVRTADCAAVWIVDPERACLALVHAGWRGAAYGIIRRAVDALRAQGGDPATVVAAVGPHVRPCCLEVGPEVAAHFLDIEGAVAPPEVLTAPRQREDSVSLDLGVVLASQLQSAGVPAGATHIATACTRCFVAETSGRNLLHSYRRNGKGGPLMASIGFLER